MATETTVYDQWLNKKGPKPAWSVQSIKATHFDSLHTCTDNCVCKGCGRTAGQNRNNWFEEMRKAQLEGFSNWLNPASRKPLDEVRYPEVKRDVHGNIMPEAEKPKPRTGYEFHQTLKSHVCDCGLIETQEAQEKVAKRLAQMVEPPDWRPPYLMPEDFYGW